MIIHVIADAGHKSDIDKIVLHFSGGPDVLDSENEKTVSIDLATTTKIASILSDTIVSIINPKTGQKRVTPEDVVELYNIHAKKNGWQISKTLPTVLRKSILSALKKYPSMDQWHTIMKGWESDAFFSGRSGIYDRIKIRTMLYKSRYEDFYEDGLTAQEKQAEHEDFFAQINNPANYSTFKLPGKE